MRIGTYEKNVKSGTEKMPDSTATVAFYNVDGSTYVFYLSVPEEEINVDDEELKKRGFFTTRIW